MRATVRRPLGESSSLDSDLQNCRRRLYGRGVGTGLRERKRLSAMRTIQERALDEFDSMSQEAVREILDVNDPVGSLIQIVVRYESAPQQADQAAGGPWRRVRYFFQEPSVRTAALAELDRAGSRIAPLLAGSNGMTEAQARVVANALVFGYFAALEQWYLDGGDHPIATYVEEGLRPLRTIWPPPAPTTT